MSRKGFRVYGLGIGFGVEGIGFRVAGFGFWVLCIGFRV